MDVFSAVLLVRRVLVPPLSWSCTGHLMGDYSPPADPQPWRGGSANEHKVMGDHASAACVRLLQD